MGFLGLGLGASLNYTQLYMYDFVSCDFMIPNDCDDSSVFEINSNVAAFFLSEGWNKRLMSGMLATFIFSSAFSKSLCEF